MLTKMKIDEFTQCSKFSSATGSDEIFIAIRSRPGIAFMTALEELSQHYAYALDSSGLTNDTVAFSRLFVSDIMNQKAPLLASKLFGRLAAGALSIIEQKPINGGQISLLAWHISGKTQKISRRRRELSADGWSNDILLKGGHYTLHLGANLTGDPATGAYAQTRRIFGVFADLLEAESMTPLGNAARTWVFVRDVDCQYADMVRARREFFAAHGLTDATRYLASTGIQGSADHPGHLVSIDTLAIGGMAPDQMTRIEAPDHLSPTILYGVTFERGAAVRFGDRSHLYISGTASINNKGEALFPGDPERQTHRAFENVRALLATRKAALGDMAYIIAYARNFHDRELIAAVLLEEAGETVPLIFAEAPVCRPAWLVELEGVAIVPDQSEYPVFL